MASSAGDHGVHMNGRNALKPFIIGVAGGTASGKSSVCEKIMKVLGADCVEDRQHQVVTISEDCFYRVLSPEEHEAAKKGTFNFDHPEAINFEKILSTMSAIKEGRAVSVPVYDFINHRAMPAGKDETRKVFPADVVLFEGILAFYNKDLRDLFDMKLFVDLDADTRLARRVLQDTTERGRSLNAVLNQYTTLVKPAFEEFCLPTKKYADIIIPKGSENEVAINLIVQHIRDLLQPKPESRSRRPRYLSDSVAHARPH